jgi:osmotically-inducible protein OsmY
VEAAPQPVAPESFSEAWAAVATDRTRASQAEGFTIERQDDGTIVAFREVQQVSGSEADEPVDTDGVRTGVMEQLETGAAFDTSFIDVAVDEGEIVLSGSVTSTDDVAQLVRAALAAPGVDRVVSRLDHTPLP